MQNSTVKYHILYAFMNKGIPQLQAFVSVWCLLISQAYRLVCRHVLTQPSLIPRYIASITTTCWVYITVVLDGVISPARSRIVREYSSSCGKFCLMKIPAWGNHIEQLLIMT